MYVVRIGALEGRDWRLEEETWVQVRWGDEARRTCGRFNEPLVWNEPLLFERPHGGEAVRLEVVQQSPLGTAEVAGSAELPFRKGEFTAAGVSGEMLTVIDGALRQVLRLTEENQSLRRRRAPADQGGTAPP